MKLVERHIISQNHPLWSEIDHYAFLSKNLFNLANALLELSEIPDGIQILKPLVDKCHRADPGFDSIGSIDRKR